MGQIIVAAQIVQDAIFRFFMAEVCYIARSYEFATTAVFPQSFGNLEAVELFLLAFLPMQHESIPFDVENLQLA